jgi:hypothetical protein
VSQVEGVVLTSSNTSPGTLLLVIGAQQIECAVLQGSGAQARWHPSSLRKVSINPSDGIESSGQAVVAALQRLQAEPALPPVAQLRVLVADCWLALAGVPWSARLLRADSAHSFARAQLQAAGFELHGEDTLKIDDAPFGAPRLVAAYPANMLAALEQWALRLNARLGSVRALSLAAWGWAQHRDAARPSALVVMDAGLVLVGRATPARQPRLSELTVRALAHGRLPTPQDVRGLWQRLCLREPALAAVQRVAVLDLCGADDSRPALEQPFALVQLPVLEGALGVSGGLRLAAAVRAWRDSMDAVDEGATSPSAWRWPLLGVAALLAGVLTWQATQANLAVRAVTARLDASSVTPVAPKITAWNREELARVQAVNLAIRELNLPMAGLLRALEPPRDLAVAVLSVEHSGGAASGAGAGLKITAEAHTGEDMARYVAFVATRRPFTGAYLTRHEVEAGAAEQPYRFTLEASWDE